MIIGSVAEVNILLLYNLVCSSQLCCSMLELEQICPGQL